VAALLLLLLHQPCKQTSSLIALSRHIAAYHAYCTPLPAWVCNNCTACQSRTRLPRCASKTILIYYAGCRGRYVGKQTVFQHLVFSQLHRGLINLHRQIFFHLCGFLWENCRYGPLSSDRDPTNFCFVLHCL